MLYFFLFCPRIFDYIEMICYHKKTPAAEVCVNICHPQKSLFLRAANQRQAHVKSKEYLVLIVSVRVKTVNISIFLSESDNNFKITGKNKKAKLRNEKSKRRLSGVGFSDIIMWRMEIYTCLTEQEAVWRKKKLETRQMYQDFNYVSEEGSWIHLEFESDAVTDDDLRRFREYEAATSRTFHVAVITYVICSSKVKRLKAALVEGINVYHVKIIRLKDDDADQLLSGLEEKQKQGIPLEKAELVSLLLTPLMSGSMEIGDRIIKSFGILKKSGDAVTEMELEKMYAVLYTLADKFLSEKELNRVKEMLAMTKLGTMLFNDGKAEGRAEGKAELVAIIRKKRKKGHNISDIAKALELDMVYVKEVADLIDEDPARTDLQVAEILISQS